LARRVPQCLNGSTATVGDVPSSLATMSARRQRHSANVSKVTALQITAAAACCCGGGGGGGVEVCSEWSVAWSAGGSADPNPTAGRSAFLPINQRCDRRAEQSSGVGER